MSQITRTEGLVGNTAYKAPCRVATTVSIAHSGLLTIDGVTVAVGDRVLDKDNADATARGIWVADSAAWNRAQDFDGTDDFAQGTLVTINEGTANGASVWRLTTVAPAIGNALTFQKATVSSSATASFILGGVGPITRTMQDKGRDYATLRDFGAACDAVDPGNNTITGTDDTAAVQAALTWSAANGRTVYHTDGKCKITATVTWPDNANLICSPGAAFYNTGAGYCFVNGSANARHGFGEAELNINLYNATAGGMHLINTVYSKLSLGMQGYLPTSGLPADYAARTNIGLLIESNGADVGWNYYKKLNFNHLHTGVQEVGNAPWTINNNEYGIVYFFGDYVYGDTGSVGMQISNSANQRIQGGSIEYYGSAGIHLQGASNGWIMGPLWFETPAGGGVGIIFENDCYENELRVTNGQFERASGGAATAVWDKRVADQSNIIQRGYWHESWNHEVRSTLRVDQGMYLGTGPTLAGNAIRNTGFEIKGSWSEITQRATGVTAVASVIIAPSMGGDGAGVAFIRGVATAGAGLPKRFFDQIVYNTDTDSVAVISSTNYAGAPGARTYAIAGNQVTCLVAGADTYSTNALAYEANNPA